MAARTSEKTDRFIGLMREIFELDKSNLDFGIYRIINMRRDDIEKFLSIDLPKRIHEILEPFATDNSSINKRVLEIEKMCEDVGVEISASEFSKEHDELMEILAAGADIDALEADVYAALYSFFSRYYSEGDFISKRRYKEGVYAIPYEGEEVKLYWANQDQYYIKTSENFKDYSFKVGAQRVHFRIVVAQTEQNNNREVKEDLRTFIIYDENKGHSGIKAIEEIDSELIIRFSFGLIQKKELSDVKAFNYMTIENYITSHFPKWIDLIKTIHKKDTSVETTLLKEHLERFTSKNTFDYFIHKDLGNFLLRELDFFVKNEILRIDDLLSGVGSWNIKNINQIRAIVEIGKKIIEFLAQIENYQVKLWLKKKFVKETNWLITLDKVDRSLYADIANNRKQIDEWIELYQINEIKKDLLSPGYTNPLSIEFLTNNQNLVIDTKHFSKEFKEKCISFFDNLYSQTEGECIHGENFQAIRLLKKNYSQSIQEIFIDPPFNLQQNGDFLYKTDYKDSTWLTMLENRINESRGLLKDCGFFLIRCDINGNSLVRQLCDKIFGNDNFEAELLVQRIRKNVTEQGKITLPLANDSIFVYSNSQRSVFANPYKKLDATRDAYWRRMDDSSGFRNPPQRNIFGKVFYPYKKDAHFKQSQKNIESMILERKIRILCKSCKYEHYEGFWEQCPICGGNDCTPQYLVPETDEEVLDTNWMDLPGYSYNWGFSTENALPLIERAISLGSFRDSSVMDFFGGSGTTGHAVISLNRMDGGCRKYIMVEMGDHFFSILMPRMKKVMYSPDWTKGVLKNRASKTSHMMKYIELENYEDTLLNIRISEKQKTLLEAIGQDYLIRYSLINDYSSLSGVLRNPFDAKMKVTEKNETKERDIDVIQTFNYLIGVKVEQQSTISSFSIQNHAIYENTKGAHKLMNIRGILPTGERCLIIWRNITNDLKQCNDVLEYYYNKVVLENVNVVYINGDCALKETLGSIDNLEVFDSVIEFRERMFEDTD